MDQGLKLALKTAGGFRPLGRILGITHVSILYWKQIPIERVFELEQILDIPREKLRPDVFCRPRPKRYSHQENK